MFIDELIDNIQCRTCTELVENNMKFIKIKSCLIMEKDVEISISEIIQNLTSLEITENDGLTQEICEKCLEKLTNAYIFRLECIKTDTILRNSYKISSSTPVKCGYVFDSLDLLDDNIELPTLENSLLRDISHLSKEFNISDRNINNDSITEIPDYQNIIYHPDDLIDNASNGLSIPCNEIDEQDSSLWKKYLKCDNTSEYQNCEANENIPCANVPSTHSQSKNGKDEENDANVPVNTLNMKKAEFICDICGKSFATKGVYKKHKQRHSDKKQFNCSKCTKSFISNDDLKNHKLTHKGKSYLCEECGAKFTRKDSLKMHTKIHLNIKPHPCSYCDKRFLNPYNLQNHIRTHIECSPYVCSTCNKEFKQRTALKRHELIHQKKTEKLLK